MPAPSLPRLARFALVLLGLCGALAAQGSPPENRLRNGSFEARDPSGDPLHWRRSTWSGEASLTIVDEDAPDGTWAARISSSAGADVSFSQRVTVEPHARYRLSARVRLENVAGAGHGVLVNPHELGEDGRSEGLTGTRDWTLLETRFEVGDRREILVNLTLGGWGQVTGTAWFDDVRLVRLPDPTRETSPAERRRHFEEAVLPLLRRECFDCHGPESELEGDLFLGRREDIVAGGRTGPAVDPERPEESLILPALRHEGLEMPPGRKLDPESIAAIELWIRGGAVFPSELESPRPTVTRSGPSVEEALRSHWAFQPVADRDPPATPGADNPVDAFVLSALREDGLALSPPADPAALVRRLSFDLTGLPPDPREVAAFAADPSDEAWSALVDRYLASFAYGEKWGRHWLDLVRYAETNSFERDARKPFVWRYRDWVIRAFAEDVPFDRFLTEQLAGDEIDEPSAGSRIATGYFRLGQWDDEPADAELARFDEFDDLVSTTAQTFLGLTVNCARCHDHKIDPIPQRDYYRMLALFRGVQRYGERSPESVEEASIAVIADAAARARHAADDERWRSDLAAIEARMAAVEALAKPGFAPVEHEEFRHRNRRLELIEKQVPARVDAAAFAAYREDFAAAESLRAAPPEALARALVVKEVGAEPPPTRILARGNPAAPGARVRPGFPVVLGGGDAPDLGPRDGGRSSGRRLALARWLVAPAHPLTARVFVNRIWQHHFGRGLVETSSDFGLQGARPSHPALLDWLATEFVRGGWRAKRMHRIILTSRTWRQAAAATAETLARDPGAVRLSHFPRRRLTAEELRDSILAASGLLDLRSGGPSVHPPIPAAVLAGQSKPGDGWPVSPAPDRHRRSVYVHVKRSLLLPILAAHDAADTDFTCPVRYESLQPTQALSLMNGTFLDEQSRAFAALAVDAADDDSGRARWVLRRALSREPREEEVARAASFLRSFRETDKAGPDEALRALALLAMNLNEFIYLD